MTATWKKVGLTKEAKGDGEDERIIFRIMGVEGVLSFHLCF